MPRNYVKTGNPPGRPKKGFNPDGTPKELGAELQRKSRAKLAGSLEEIAAATGLTLPGVLALPKIDLGDEKDPEKLMKAAVAQMMAGLHTQLPTALERIAIRRPEIVISFYRDMAEYLMPKLSRLEQSGTVNHKHQHFVAVEEREADPRLPAIELKADEDGTFVVPG